MECVAIQSACAARTEWADRLLAEKSLPQTQWSVMVFIRRPG
jgi:hypothetical protein